MAKIHIINPSMCSWLHGVVCSVLLYCWRLCQQRSFPLTFYCSLIMKMVSRCARAPYQLPIDVYLQMLQKVKGKITSTFYVICPAGIRKCHCCVYYNSFLLFISINYLTESLLREHQAIYKSGLSVGWVNDFFQFLMQHPSIPLLSFWTIIRPSSQWW